jgi:hypothetical protein
VTDLRPLCDKEFDSVLALPGDRRYAYFLGREADYDVEEFQAGVETLRQSRQLPWS